jgi:nitrogen regulatory protein PII
MKKIEVIMNHGKVDSLYAALAKTEWPGLIVHEMECVNRTISLDQETRRRKGRSSLTSKAKIEILSGDGDIDRLVETICASGIISEAGDERIYVSPVETATL